MKIENIVCIYVCVCVCVCVCVYIYIYIYMYEHMYMYIYVCVVVMSAMLLTINVVLGGCWCPWVPLDSGRNKKLYSPM